LMNLFMSIHSLVALQKAAFKNNIQNDRYYNFLRGGHIGPPLPQC